MLRGSSRSKLVGYVSSIKSGLSRKRLLCQHRLKSTLESDPAVQQGVSLFLQYHQRDGRRDDHQNNENTNNRTSDGTNSTNSNSGMRSRRKIGSGIASTIVAAAAVAVVSADSDKTIQASNVSDIPVVLRPPAPNTAHRVVRLIVALIKVGIALAYYCCVLPVAFALDRIFKLQTRDKAYGMLTSANGFVESIFSGLTGLNATQIYDERYIVDFVRRGAEALLETMIANYAIQQLYKHPFVAEKYGKLEFNTSKGDAFLRAVLADADLIPMTPKTYKFTLHGSKVGRPLRVVAQVALGPPHGASVADSERYNLAVHTIYLAIEDPETKERIVVVDPKNYHAQRLSTSVLRLLDDRSRLALVEGTSLTSVVVSEQKLGKKSFSKTHEFSFSFCGSRGCAQIRSDTKQQPDASNPQLATCGSTSVDISNKDGFSSRTSFNEEQIAAADTVSFIELLRPVRDRLGGPLTVEASSIKSGLDVEIDKVINTVDMTLRGPAGQSAPVHVVFLVDPLHPSHKILWRVSWGDNSDIVYENTVSVLQKLAEPENE